MNEYIGMNENMIQLLPYLDWAFCQPKKTEGQDAPPNLAISSWMATKLGRNKLWVEIFRN